MYLRTKRNKKRYQKKKVIILLKVMWKIVKIQSKIKVKVIKIKRKNTQISNLTKTYYIKN